MSQLLALWHRSRSLPVVGPVVGARLFSFAFSQKAPYFSSVRPRFTVIEPNHAELVITDRRRVRNHLGTVHAIALCNGVEAAMGALAEATIPSSRRWIPKGMTVTYPAKAVGDITCIAETDAEQWGSDLPDLPVRVRGVDQHGVVVIEGVINLWVTDERTGPAEAVAS
jgi:acyl-coenzyme A thioesterase PaaI-like protein